MRTLVFLAIASITFACGGGSVEAPAPAPTPPAQPTPAPPPVPVVEEDPNSELVWYVYWEGIHCLTVYPQPGLVRSEEPHNASPTFSSRNEHFSVISAYYEREDELAPVIEAATSLEDLLERMAAMADSEVEEAINPIQSDY
ncbi:MAG: hypothetical protein ACJAYU_003405 [Bradymonadia bacterium]|jgi:hypothetical protein